MEATIAGAPAWILALDRDPGGAAALQRWAARHLEAAILAHVSAPCPRAVGETPEGYGAIPTGGVHLFVYAPIEGDVRRALAPFGLTPSELSGPRWDEVRAALREAVPDAPLVATYSARVVARPALRSLHDALVADTEEVWGAAPGQPAARLLHVAHDLLGREHDADLAGLDAVEALIVDRTPGVLRWLPPLVLQALADLVGAVALRTLGSRVEWAECAPEPDGFTPPPLLRLTTRRAPEPVHLPIAHHLVRWCVMPLLAGEQAAPLSAWLADEVTGA